MSNRGQDRGRPRGGGGGGGGRGGDRGRGSPSDRGRGGGFVDRGRGGGGFGGPPRGRGRGGPPGGGDGGSLIFREGQPTQVDTRLANNAEQNVVTAFNKAVASLAYDPRRPLRPGYGTLGRAITLRANFFALRLPKGPYYEYIIEVTPDIGLNKLKPRIFQLLERTPACQPFVPHIAHDNSQRMVSARKLPQPLDIQIPFIEEGATAPLPNARTYMVSIKFSAELDLAAMTEYLAGKPGSRDFNPDPLLSALNLILQQHSQRTAVRVGKNRYFDPSDVNTPRHQLSMNMYAIQGFHASVRPAFNQLMVNVNVCMTAFISPGRLDDMLSSFSRNSSGAMPSLPPSLAKSIRVTTTYLGYKKRKAIKRIGTTSARNTFFDCDEYGKKISVEEYFKRKYNITLKQANTLPVIDTAGPTNRTPVWVPAELCTVDVQAYRGKLSSDETAAMILAACQPPATNARSIMNTGLHKLALTPDEINAPTNPLQGFGIQVRQEMAIVPARILPPPSLSYKAGRPPNVRSGAWNILDVKFHRGGIIRNWWVLYVREEKTALFSGPQDPALSRLVTGFIGKCQRSGMNIEKPDPLRLAVALPPPYNDPGRLRALDLIRKQFQQSIEKFGKPSFVLVLLSQQDNYIYPGIKKIGDVELGVHTLHMLLKPGRNALGDDNKADQYFSNVALKLNTKLGGVNHTLDPKDMAWLKKKRTMIVGIDVTHPSPGSREGTPSIAAVVASVDDAFVQFPASLRLQDRSKKEMVDNLDDIMLERLQIYSKKNKSLLPEKIIIYRDGVSEGQFDTVLEQELPLIKEAIKKVPSKEKGSYKPALTIIICGKRHHARFPATNAEHADPKHGNTLPGTIVDRGITNVYEFDFYLQAHAGLQGTVRPTHYTVVYDENRMGVDEIQQGTHTSSYAYARATKAVSLIPPAYYADLACERGRCYLNDFLVSDDQSSATGSSGRSKLDKEAEKKKVFDAAVRAWGQGLHADVRESMFYL